MLILFKTCATENYAIKTKLMRIIGKYAKQNAGLFHLARQVCCQQEYILNVRNPARTMIGHPFNPVYMLSRCRTLFLVKKQKRNF